MRPDASEPVNVGVVAIGRNEGERLRRCLDAVAGRVRRVIYVDSGSQDDSVEMARSKGAAVVELDMSVPFTAARGRNAGFERLVELVPDVEFVQFVDGDCEIHPSWVSRAVEEMKGQPDVVVVCGRRRERFRDRSIYNRLMDMEWNTPIGDADACGGDALMRCDSLRRVGGFNSSMIAGEEPELCLRLRRQGGRIRRIDADMTLHDAAMTRFSQWWRRSVRNGYAFALGAGLHGGSSDRHWVRESLRGVLWAGILPLVSIGAVGITRRWSLLLLAAYPLWTARIALQRRRERGDSVRDAWIYAAFCMLGKFPQLLGQTRYAWHRLRGRSGALIEYK
jgi:GT2 family glycosyltransferase